MHEPTGMLRCLLWRAEAPLWVLRKKLPRQVQPEGLGLQEGSRERSRVREVRFVAGCEGSKGRMCDRGKVPPQLIWDPCSLAQDRHLATAG